VFQEDANAHPFTYINNVKPVALATWLSVISGFWFENARSTDRPRASDVMKSPSLSRSTALRRFSRTLIVPMLRKPNARAREKADFRASLNELRCAEPCA
jgi:hypothetical protein